MQQFEYKTVALAFEFGFFSKSNPDIEAALNLHAAEGWRLLQILQPAKQLGETSEFIVVLERALL